MFTRLSVEQARGSKNDKMSKFFVSHISTWGLVWKHFFFLGKAFLKYYDDKTYGPVWALASISLGKIWSSMPEVFSEGA